MSKQNARTPLLSTPGSLPGISEVGNDNMTNRKSIVKEDILDDLPKVVGFICNPNASPLNKEHEQANEIFVCCNLGDGAVHSDR